MNRKLNLGGGGGFRRPDWDNLEFEIGYDLTKKLLSPYENDSVEIIYTSHCLEHLPVGKTDLLLKDCYRVLKTGGVMRVILPSADLMWELLENGDKSDLQKHNCVYYTTGKGKDYSLGQCVYELFGYKPNGTSLFNGTMHIAFFTPSILKVMLRAAGFGEIKDCSFADSSIAELEKIDNPHTQDISMYVECLK